MTMEVVVERGRDLVTTDGVRLMMDVYRPALAGVAIDEPRAVILERTPYSRSHPRVSGFAHRAASRGFVFVAQDVRGRGDSEGTFGMLFGEPDEGSDGADTARWLHQQPWCDGRIATVGSSFSATNQQALALRKPPGLCVQILRDAGTNYYRRMLRYHGAANVGAILPWILDQAIASPDLQGNEDARAELQDMRAHLGEWIGRLPLRRSGSPLRHAPVYEDLYFALIETADDERLWHNAAARLEGRWDEYPTGVAVLLISGWFAHHCAANLDKYVEFDKRLEHPVAMVLGPWLHTPDMLEATTTGDCDFGAAAAFGTVHDVWMEWLERHLADAPRSATPRVRYFLMGTGDGHRTGEGRIFHGGVWRSSASWPPAGSRETPLYLAGGGRLRFSPPRETNDASGYAFDPHDPCPGIGSANLQITDAPDFVLPGPREQRCRPTMAACRGSAALLQERADVLVFQTEPLPRALEVTGSVVARLWVRTSAPDTDFVARLIDVYPPSAMHPGGLALGLCDGILRLRYRHRRPVGELVQPHALHEIEIELNPTSNLFKAGHRIRLDITSSAWPQYDVNPNTGELPRAGQATAIAVQSVHHDALHPSCIRLNLMPASEAGAHDAPAA